MKIEIKKALYKEKPIAIRYGDITAQYWQYNTILKDGTNVDFVIPISEINDNFQEAMPAQLLIRWML